MTAGWFDILCGSGWLWVIELVVMEVNSKLRRRSVYVSHIGLSAPTELREDPERSQ